jgi:hypothetical protein
VRVRTDSYDSGQGSVAGSCEHGNEPSGFIKDREFVDQPSHNELLNMELYITDISEIQSHNFILIRVKPPIKHSNAINKEQLRKNLKSTIFWDITLCSPLKINRHFGGTYRLYIQGERIS